MPVKAIDSARALDPAGAAARKNHEAGIAPFAQHFSELPHFQRKGLTEHIVSRMKEWVLGGLISPGDRLPPERELAKTVGVSRSSLRQALKALQVMGGLAVRQGAGNYLTDAAARILGQPPDFLVPLRGHSFGELYELRRAIEAEAAAAAAVRANDEDLRKLDRILASMKAHLDNSPAYFKDDVGLHSSMVAASGNKLFVWLFDMLYQALKDQWQAASLKR